MDFNPILVKREYGDLYPEERKEYSFSTSKFLAYLISKGLLLEINYDTFYLGEYGDFESVGYFPFENK